MQEQLHIYFYHGTALYTLSDHVYTVLGNADISIPYLPCYRRSESSVKSRHQSLPPSV